MTSTRSYTLTIDTTNEELLDQVCQYLFERGMLGRIVKRLLSQWIEEKQQEYHERGATDRRQVPEGMTPW